MTAELYPCPFCMRATGVQIQEVSPQQYAVCCPACRATGPVDASPDEAATLWNAGLILDTDDFIDQIGGLG